MWKHRGEEAITHFEALISLAKRYGFNARLPIAWHDLAEAFRTNLEIERARDAYTMALNTAKTMGLTSAVQLIRPKLFICSLLQGRTDGVIAEIDAFIPDAQQAGLGLAEPFGRMLQAWAHSLRGELRMAKARYRAVPQMRDMAIDPHFPLIMEQFADALHRHDEEKSSKEYIEAYTLAAEFWERFGQSERGERCRKRIASG